WRSATIVGAGLMLGGNGGVALAERSIPSGVTALIAATVPLWIALFDRIWFRRALPPQRIIGVVIGFCAVAALIGRPDASGLSVIGATIAVVAAVSWAAGSLYARGAKLPEDGLTAVGMEMLARGALRVIAGGVCGELG